MLVCKMVHVVLLIVFTITMCALDMHNHVNIRKLAVYRVHVCVLKIASHKGAFILAG